MLLAVDALHTFYGKSHVLHGVSLDVFPGEFVALLGRNGAGKTTTLATITGVVPPRDGRIAYRAADVAGRPPEEIARRGIGLVPQGRRVFPTLTVRENLVVARQERQSAATHWTFERVLELFPSLRERQQQHAGSLSGGEQQMLAIGRALMGNPRVLLMDEPSEGLAPRIVAEVGRTIARLKQEGQSIVLVEQNVNLALALADEVVMLNTGRVVFAGSVDEVRNDQALITQHLGVF